MILGRVRVWRVTTYSRADVAERVGVEPAYLARLVDLGILSPKEPDRFGSGDVRRVLMARSLEDAGIPLDGVAGGHAAGRLDARFPRRAELRAIAALAPETFQQVSELTGIHSSC
jgi:adenylate cyclase